MKFSLIIGALITGLLVAGVATASEVKMKQRFAGAGHPTMVDTNDDGEFASAISFDLWGSPGRSTMQAVAEFTGLSGTEIAGCELRSELVQESYVATYNDGSMLFGEATDGYSCVDVSTFEVTSAIEGVFTGGTGRFKGATGSWSVEAEVFFVGETGTALTGNAKGTIVLPD